ncbi:RNA polymerase sigma factor [Microbacterium arabinogalactanolyticum]|uniref:RNA polymerase sigma factor n=1 Tax=Microbacterium arabinogalactanolyticum TaxID=69365 RepID=UPI002552CD6F|nr:RNA polymerase sigma factor [Microbacterium arabinogalactanolyticum]GLC86081.1 RNA polymerase sigma factor [Microbacterium arabinogalactanolyticum]
MTADERRVRVERAVQDHASALLGYFVRRVALREDAADLLAETLLVLWRRSRSLPDADDDVRPWMFGIARNVLLHHQRGGARRHAVVEKLRGVLEATPHPGFADPAEHDELHRALAQLDPLDRDIIGLLHWEGFSLVEVARMLRMKEGTVRSRYHRARAALREQLADAAVRSN